MPMAITVADTMAATFRCFRKLMEGRGKICRMRRSTTSPRYRPISSMVRVTKSAVNMLKMMPHESVTANPLTGPVPTMYRITAVMRVVRLASKMVRKARW